MEENFDFDAQINKIKNQMKEEFKDNNDSDNSVFRAGEEEISEDVINLLPSDEPSLDNYFSGEENITEAKEPVSEEFLTDSPQEANIESALEAESQYSDWQDPFGGVYENDAVKKYVIYVSKEFVPYIDDLDSDARSAFVNDALQLKTELGSRDRKLFLFTKALKHIFISILTLIVAIPCLFWLADKSIMATINNYSYVQQNFEKLYKERVDREKAIQKIDIMNKR